MKIFEFKECKNCGGIYQILCDENFNLDYCPYCNVKNEVEEKKK